MPLAEDQAALLPEDIRSDPSLQSFSDFGGIAKGFIETKALVGRSIQLPGKDSKPEDVDKWAGETGAKLKDHGYAMVKASDIPAGAPASPDAYEFKIEGVPPEVIKGDKILGEFRAVAHEMGMSNERAAKLVDWYINKARQQQDAEKQLAVLGGGAEALGKVAPFIQASRDAASSGKAAA